MAKPHKITEADAAYLHDKYVYSPETGVISYKSKLSWKEKTEAGKRNNAGYIQIRVGKKTIVAHRVAWFMFYGKEPVNEIDHINCIKSDNRISNLRDVDRKTNTQNVFMASKNSKTGALGVQLKSGKYIAVIKVQGVAKQLGTFSNISDAAEAYIKAKRLYHGGCTV